MRSTEIAIGMVVVALSALPASSPASTDDWRQHFTLTLSDRVRWESVDWFDPAPGLYPPGADRSSYFANQLRFGAKIKFPAATVVVEGQDVRLWNVPDDATRATPPGNLGPGANYYQYTPETDQGATILRQAHVTAQSGGFGATLGRFDWGEGVETLPKDADLLWLKRTRITERLVGPFGYTHAARTFDGARLWYDGPAWNATGVAVRPTAGGFEVEAGEELDEVALLGLSASTKTMPWDAPADGRAFWFHYEDERVEDGRPVRVDNRPAGARAADSTMIRFDTFGMNLATVVGVGAARLDGLGWAAWQRGDWGRQDHSAFAWAIEGGVHWPKWWGSPWLRAGINVASGDEDVADDTHGTFVPLLTTPRIYALTPFYTAMNLDDRFMQLIVKPVAKVTVRVDYHDLRLAESSDLWYAGGGAIRDDIFGYGGLPSSGSDDLARLVDLGVTWAPVRQLSVYGYYGRVLGDAVVRGQFAGEDTIYGYLEATYRY